MSAADPGGAPAARVDLTGGKGVQVGDGGIQVNVFRGQPPSARSAGQVVAGNVPQAPQAFQPREDLREALHAAGPGVSVVRAVTGMRGVGKTQVAAAYARECMDSGWRLVAWINAEDAAGVLNGLAAVADRLGLRRQDADLQTLAQLVRNRLEADGERHLVVFDNVTDIGGLRSYLPAAGKSQVVVTSTAGAAASLGQPLQVDVYTEEEALAFLAERTGRIDPDGAREVAQELGYLPLALAQAAAVIASHRLTYLVYLERLRTIPLEDYLTSRDGEPYPQGAGEAILLSVDAVAAADEAGLCGPVLDMVSMMSNTGISRELLYVGGSEGLLSEDAALAPAIDEALGRLADASLLTFIGDGSTVSAHRLVKRVIREWHVHQGSLAAVGTRACNVLCAVARTLADPWENRPLAWDIAQHAIALHGHLVPHLGDGDGVLVESMLNLRGWAFLCLIKLGYSVQAAEFGERLLDDSERVMGDAHPDTIRIRNDLAGAYLEAGQAAEAIPLLERTLADDERVRGKTHPHTMTAGSNLAAAYLHAERTEKAVALLERILTDRTRMLGTSHPDTLATYGNLAAAYVEAARVADAIALLERSLPDGTRVLGKAHPTTLNFRANLASAYRKAGRAGEAIPLLEQTLADLEHVLGETHPHTLTARNNLAGLYREAGRLDEALPLYERVLGETERILGRDHPTTAVVCRGLVAAKREAEERGRQPPGTVY